MTQYVWLPGSEILKKHNKSPYPALNVFCREEPVADVYGMKSEKQLVNTLEDNIHEQGAMKFLISDSAQS
jgi:hypothetical protein